MLLGVSLVSTFNSFVHIPYMRSKRGYYLVLLILHDKVLKGYVLSKFCWYTVFFSRFWSKCIKHIREWGHAHFSNILICDPPLYVFKFLILHLTEFGAFGNCSITPIFLFRCQDSSRYIYFYFSFSLHGQMYGPADVRL